ncbi:MAG: DUF1925 domain-containing protein [Gemmatimonadota bacterium]|nr:DUF1925 domain-containing protein [Gemmatimonadota bacterium]
MSSLRFSFVLHIHQPVGNFDHVFRDHAVDVYRPFFDFLADRELWPIGLHASGSLIEWLGDHDAEFHDRVGQLADDRKIELLSGGWYEPILAALSREDRATQLGWMREELESRFGVTPTGAWLTERVWEPDLPRDLVDAGLEYTLVDDHLARRAGVPEESLRTPLRTESDGRQLDLLPIDERLRYLIPFRPAEEIEADLRRRCEAGDRLALIGDDGEKFGGWPKTREWLYDRGWLADFGERMDRLRAEGVVRLVTPARARSEVAASGPVYLPSGSYPEMESWALGGHWKGFLTRYEEANRMHKRAATLSELCRELGDPPDARRAVGRAQCNDAYWHGVFGGLYMKHLREGVRRQMAIAERKLRVGKRLTWSAEDVSATGRLGWWAHSSKVSAWIDPARGGTVSDLIWLERGIDLVDVLTRRTEAYHVEAVDRGARLGLDAEGGGADAAASIHDIEEASTLTRLPAVDKEVRTLVCDRVLDADVSPDDYRNGEYVAVWVAGTARADHPDRVTDESRWSSLMWRFEPLPGNDDAAPRVQKVISLRDDGVLTLMWNWDVAAFPGGSVFAPELSLGTPVDLELEPETEIWRYPIITVSKCPEGFEEIEQGESVTPRWPVETGHAKVTIRPPD